MALGMDVDEDEVYVLEHLDHTAFGVSEGGQRNQAYDSDEEGFRPQGVPQGVQCAQQ